MKLKPQIVHQDVIGSNSREFEKTTSRLMKGSSWKKQRVIMIIPAADLIPAKVYLNHQCIIFPPNQGVHKILAVGCEVGDAYSTALDNVLAHPQLRDWEYVFTVEHDNLIPPDGLLKLIERMEANPWIAALSGTYFTKGAGGVCQVWGDINDPIVNFRPQLPPAPGTVKECHGIGMGCALWRMSMFRDARFPKPLFKTMASKDGVGTQDLAFAGEARKLGYRFAVDGDVCSGHYDYEGKFGPPDFVW